MRKKLEANGEEPHLDADVQVRAPKNLQVEDFAGDAAAAAPEQMQTKEKSMNRFAPNKTEVFENIEESPRQCKGVEDLNDNDTMEFCILSNELNACETTTILNPSRFVSHAT